MRSIRLGDSFTEAVISATGPGADERSRTVFASLIRHIHDFARENRITVEEWSKAVDVINWSGQISNDKRNETQLICDILGLESIVDEISNSIVTSSVGEPTSTAILGPFYRNDTPPTPNDSSIIRTDPGNAEFVFMHGTVSDATTGKPVVGAKIDIWQCSTNGLYEQQDPEQAEWNLRGKFTSSEEGYYGAYCIRPVPYPIPYDGPAGALLKVLDRHPWRPAHIHLFVTVPGYAPLITQIYDKNSKYVDNDSVFAVKNDLLVDFKPLENNSGAKLELDYDIRLAPIQT